MRQWIIGITLLFVSTNMAAAQTPAEKAAENELYAQGLTAEGEVIAVLKNDKLELYQTEVVRDFVVFYDGNGKLLETPEDFAKAKYWIFPWTTYAGAVQMWKLQGYVFKSDMQLDQEFYIEGIGDRVPRTSWPKE